MFTNSSRRSGADPFLSSFSEIQPPLSYPSATSGTAKSGHVTAVQEDLPYTARFQFPGVFGHIASFPLDAPAKPASEIADALIRFTLRNGIDKSWLNRVIDKGKALGPVPQLRCVYVSPAMEDILGQPQNYSDLTDLLDEFNRREDEVTSCLSFWDKAFYGTRLRSFGDDLWSQPAFFDSFTLEFAALTGVAPGQGAVNLFSYFFRKDRLDAKSIEVLDLFHTRLRSILGII